MAKLFQIAIVIALAYATAFYTTDNHNGKNLFDFNFNFDIEKFIKENFEDSNTNNLDLLLSDGIYYFEMKDYYTALNNFKQIIELDPSNLEANYYLAATYEALSDFYQAEIIYKALIQDSVYLSQSYTGLSKIYLSKTLLDSALIFGNKAIESDSNNYLAYNQRAECFFQTNDTISALKDLEFSISINSIYETNFRIAEINFSKKNYQKTTEYISKCLEFQNADFYSCYYKRALSYYYLKDYSNSINDYNKALEISSSDVYIYYNMAIAYDSMNDTVNAIKNFELFTVSTQNFDQFYDYSMNRLKELKNIN